MKNSIWSCRKRGSTLILICLVYSVLWGHLLPQNIDAQPTDALTYRPPQRGVPGGREGAGSRGLGKSLPILTVLAPKDHMGLTVQEQPVLYWYLSHETQHPVAVTLTEWQSVKPLLEMQLNPPLQPGMQRVRLADYGIRLASGVSYRWSVALVPNATQRSQDIITAGTIERIALPDELRNQLAQTDKMTSPRLYARAGLWYDTIAALSELIDAAPQNTTLRQQRATLLEQEELTQAAAYDRQHK
jgi:Domain of Unknown Function (DUF928)